MNKTRPLDFSIASVSDSSKPFRSANIFLTNEFGIAYDMSHQIRELISAGGTAVLPDAFFFRLRQPYRLKEGRIILLLQGQVVIRYNLIEYIIRPAQVLVVPAGSIIEITGVHPDTVLRMVGFSPVFIPSACKEDVDYYRGGYRQSVILPLSDGQRGIAEGYFRLLWEMVQADGFPREPVQHLLTSLIHFIDDMRKGYRPAGGGNATHQDRLFGRFIALVNEHCVSERNVKFYAGKLCLTPRYLNTVIRQASGQTVMDWVDQAVVVEAKIRLKHDNLPVYRVADELRFANPSFFCKFFKRMTGMTPQEYRTG
ncbi:MAG: helix-turn-helix domain-containing protein [Mediterranea sp.]|jgi:AraC-like DNA-binding protein|nr:helix-turn-helix domain-containing protein [Mediterranea sp.]